MNLPLYNSSSINIVHALRQVLNGSEINNPGISWDALIRQAELHLLAPRLHRLVFESKNEKKLSPKQRHRLEQNQILSHRVHILAEIYLRKLLERFAAKGIPVICLKGWAFAQRYYRIPTDRGFYDLDLLFRNQDRRAVRSVLIENSYRLSSAHSDWQPIAEKEEYKATGHVSPPVEAHYGLGYGRFRFEEELWDRSQQFKTSSGLVVRVLNPEDEYLFLTYHLGVQHRFQKLGWLLDLIQMRKRGFYPTHIPESLRPALKYTERLIADCRSDEPSKAFVAIALGYNERSWIRRFLLRVHLQGGILELAKYLYGRLQYSKGLRKLKEKKRIGSKNTEDAFSAMLELPKENLKEFVFVANGSSMIPTIVLGDRLHARRLEGDPALGDIVVCQDLDEKWRVHRVIALKPVLMTKGDALPKPDPEPAKIAAVVYRVERTWKSRLRRLKINVFKALGVN